MSNWEICGFPILKFECEFRDLPEATSRKNFLLGWESLLEFGPDPRSPRCGHIARIQASKT